MKYYARLKRKSYAPHLIAYSWAGRYCYGKKVLDIGAGEGHGGIIISLFAKKLTLVDIEESNAGYQKKNTYFCPTEFVTQNLEQTPISADYDICTAFEVLEHLENPEYVLEQVSKTGKELVFSLPHNAPSRYHKQVYKSQNEVEELFKPYFDVDWFQMRKYTIQQGRFDVPHRYMGICTPKK